MTIPLANLNGHLTRLVGDIPTSGIWGAHTITGARTSPTLEQSLELGGLDVKVQFDLLVKADTLPTPKPGMGAIVTFGGTPYRVLNIRRSPDDGQLITYSFGFARQGPLTDLT